MSNKDVIPNDAGKALTNAAMEGRTDEVRRLLAAMDADARRRYGPPALEWAAWKGEAASIRLLLEPDIVPDPASRAFVGAFHAAASRGMIDVVRLLLDAGATVDSRDGAGRTVLHHIARMGNFASRRAAAEVARLVLGEGAEVEARDSEDSTPLIYACERGNAPIVEVLLAHDADPNAIRKADRYHALISRGAPALVLAAAAGSAECVRLLLDAGADIKARDREGHTALHAAAALTEQDNDAAAVIQLLVERGGNVMARNTDRATPLHLAAHVGNIAALEALLAAGAEVNANAPDVSPLYEAVWHGKTEAALTLIRHGATEDGVSDDPLVYVALREGMEELALALLDRTGELPPPPRRASSKTALMLAAEKGFMGVIEALLTLGADPNETGAKRQTALMCAAAKGESLAVRRLLQAGAAPHQTDSSGNTALETARRRRKTDVVRILEAVG